MQKEALRFHQLADNVVGFLNVGFDLGGVVATGQFGQGRIDVIDGLLHLAMGMMDPMHLLECLIEKVGLLGRRCVALIIAGLLQELVDIDQGGGRLLVIAAGIVGGGVIGHDGLEAEKDGDAEENEYGGKT